MWVEGGGCGVGVGRWVVGWKSPMGELGQVIPRVVVRAVGPGSPIFTDSPIHRLARPPACWPTPGQVVTKESILHRPGRGMRARKPTRESIHLYIFLGT